MFIIRKPSSSKALRLVFALVLLIAISKNVQSQVIFTEGFENGFPPIGWSTQNYTSNSNGWQQYTYDVHSGIYSAACFPNGANSSAWLFTKALNLVAGRRFELKYYVKVFANTRLEVTIGTGADLFSQPKILHNSFISDNSFYLVTDTIVCEQSGAYYIGFHEYSNAAYNIGSIIDDVTFTDLNYPNCSTVSAGSVSAGVSSICANTQFTLNNIGASLITTGVKYAWQKSTDNVSWTNITNSYTYQSSIQVSQAVPTYYRLADTCLISGANAVSNVLLINLSSPLTCYCTPPAIVCSENLSFANVTIFNSTINNTTACSPSGYGDYASVGNANVYRDHQIYIGHSIVNPNNYYPYTVGVWGDWNHNGAFEANEFAMNGPFYTSSVNVSQILVPASALMGETRLRIKTSVFGTITGDDACAGSQGGETEDYKITIGDAAACSGAVSAGTIMPVTQVCPNNNFTITATNPTIYKGQMRYAWQRSTDNVNWVNISHAAYLVNPFTTSTNSIAWYRLTDTCLASAQSSVSNSIQVTPGNIFNCYCVPGTSTCSTYGIDSVSFSTIHNSSGCGANGYSNYTNINSTVNNGTVQPIYLKLRPATSSPKYVSVYIDFNRNGSFEAAEKALNGVSTNGSFSGNITIPFNINPGETGMRIIASNSTVNDACASVFTGETEDYKIILNLNSPVTNKFCHYVKQSATGLNDGTSWANAFTSLAPPFALLTIGDTIKVAKGVYTPGAAVMNSFKLKDSVIIMGGYPDTGNPTDAERSPANYQSKMSGEIGVANDSTDNTTIILQASNAKGFVVDGFIIERSYNNGSGGNDKGAVYFTWATGAIKNTVVRNNYYADYNNGTAVNAVNSTVTFSNSFFEGNETGSSSGTGSVFNFSSKSNITLVNSVVAKNKASLLINQSNATVRLTNCTVFKNYGFSSIHDTSNLFVHNSIFYRNGINYTVDTAEFIKDVYSSIAVNNTITEVYNVSTPGFFGADPKFRDTANVAGADGKYFTTDDGLRLLNPCSPAINTGNNSFVSGVNTDITAGSRIKNGIVDLGAYEVQEAVTSMPLVVYVKRNATGLNNGTSWQNAFTDLQLAFYGCSDTIKVAKGIYPVSATDPDASFTLNNHRVVIGGYPDFGSPTNNDINTELYPSVLDGRVNSNLKCRTVVLSHSNDSTARLIGFEVINSASPVPDANFTSLKVAFKSNPYFEKIKLNSLTNQTGYLVYITDLSKPKFYNCSFYNGFNSGGLYTGPRGIAIRNSSEPQFIRSYIGKDTLAANTSDVGAAFTFLNSGGIIDSCTFFQTRHDGIINENSYTRIQNSNFINTNGRSINNISSSTVIFNCAFRDAGSFDDYSGGAISNNSNSNVLIDKCRFYNLKVYQNGGAVANEYSSTVIKSSLFRNCRAGFGAGALYNNGGNMKLINCIGYLNSTYLNVSQSQFLKGTGNSTTSIINSTIISDATGGNSVIQTGGGDTLKLYNSILWRYGLVTQANGIDNDVITTDNNNSSVCDIRNSILFKQSGTSLTNSTTGINPKLTDLSYPEGFDNVFYSTDDGFKPCTCSPAINTGSNSLNPESLDILGANRVYNGTIDIGAYEVPANATTDKTFFVKENAAPGGKGLNWTGAYNNLQSAVQNNCADTIKIAKGKYKPAISTRDSTFNVYRGVVILGGYPDAGNPNDQDRSVNANPTILSGDIGSLNDSTDNSYNVMTIHCPDTAVQLDGIIVERGNADGPVINGNQFGQGGGIYVSASKSLTMNKCIVRNNYGRVGGGLNYRGSGLNINKSVFSDNNSLDGGGFYTNDDYAVVGALPWSPTVNITNSVFSTNKGGGAGTIAGNGVIASQNNYHFENLVVYKNEGYGAGFRFRNQAYVTLVNCIFAKNNSLFPEAGVAIIASNNYTTLTLNTYVFNSIFVGNTIMGMEGSYLNNDFNWVNGNAQQEKIPYQNLAYSAVPGNQSGGGPGMIGNNISLQDINNGPGPDKIWMTPDDGVRPTPCAYTQDKGSNTYVQGIPLDILDSGRVQNAIVDMGPYEMGNGGAGNATATIIATDTTICTGSPVTFNAYVMGANGNTVYQWKKNNSNVGTNSSVFTISSLADNDTIKVVITINNPCVNTQTVTSNSILLHVSTAFTSAVSISSSANPACAGAPVIYTAIPVNGGLAPAFQWKKNGINAGANSPTYTASPVNNSDVITVVMTSSLNCVSNNPVTSNSITQIVNPLITASVSITSTAMGCQGTSITFMANPLNGGANPTYQWKVNGGNVGTNSPMFTSSILNENDVVTVVMTSNALCVATTVVTSPSLVVHYIMSVTASVSITSPAIGCTGTSITFTTNPLNGGTSPTYQWKVNGTNVGTNSPTFTSSTLNENDIVLVEMTSNASCVTTPVVTSSGFVVHFATATTASVNITPSATDICRGKTVTFIAVPLDGGTAPFYQWQVNGINAGTNNVVFSADNLENNDQVKVIMSGTGGCGPAYTAISNIINMQVQQLAVPLIILKSQVLTITNPDGAAAYTWQVLNNNTWENVMPTASGTIYPFSDAGTYRVKGVKGSCVQYSGSQITSLVSPNSDVISLRPNPAHNFVSLDSLRLLNEWKVVDITDMTGRHVLPLVNIANLPSVTIDISMLPPGTYLAIIKKEDGVHVTKKFVKL